MRGGFDSRRRRILAGAFGTAFLPGFVFAQAQRDAAKNREIYLYKGADREKRILEEAKKEREVAVYTSLNLKDSVPIVEVFERKYGGVKVHLWRSSSEKVLQRAVAEARAGRFSCDILETNGPEMEAMHREQLLEEFFSPHFKDLPPAAFPRHRHYVADRFNFFTIAYNTNFVKANEVPNTYEDPRSPAFRGPSRDRSERRRLVRRDGQGDGRGKGPRILQEARRGETRNAQRAYSDGRARRLGRDPARRHHLQPQRRAAGRQRRADPLEGAQAHLRAAERDRGGAPRPAPERGAALCRLHALPRRPDDPEGAQPGTLEPRRGHAPQQIPLRDDRPGDHARRGRPLGETLVGSLPQR